MLYGTITDYCTSENCPVMNAGYRYEYHWPRDPNKNNKDAIRVPAPIYVESLMTWIQSFLDNEATFPSKIGNPFPSYFLEIVKVIFKRLFRVYAHIYHSHFKTVLNELKIESQLNSSFKHFIYFTREFGLIDQSELMPLKEFIEKI